MPWRRLLSSGFLHEHMVVEELRGPRGHRLGGERGRGGIAHDALEFRDALPIAVVVEEAAGLAGAYALGGERARLAHVSIDAGGDRVDPIGEEAPQARGAVAFEGGERLGVDLWFCDHAVAPANTVSCRKHRAFGIMGPLLTADILEQLRAAARERRQQVACSLDLGRSTTTVAVSDQHWTWNGAQFPYPQACKPR